MLIWYRWLLMLGILEAKHGILWSGALEVALYKCSEFWMRNFMDLGEMWRNFSEILSLELHDYNNKSFNFYSCCCCCGCGYWGLKDEMPRLGLSWLGLRWREKSPEFERTVLKLLVWNWIVKRGFMKGLVYTLIWV